MKLVIPAIFLGFLGLYTQLLGAASEPTSPEDLLFAEISVFTASKRAQNIFEAPAAVVVITAEDIERTGARSIAEALRFTPGVNVFGFGGINIRGLGTGTRVLLLIDGRRANNIFSGGFDDGLERPVTDIERIELIKGPASSLYGTFAFSGIVSIITKKGNTSPGLNITAAAGNFTTQQYEVEWGEDRETVDTYFSASAYSDEGNDLSGDNDSRRILSLFGKVEWGDFTFSSGYRPNRIGIGNIGGILTPDSSTTSHNAFSHLIHQKSWSGKWSYFSQAYIQYFDGFLDDPDSALDFSDLRLEGEARATYSITGNDRLTFGLELTRIETENRAPQIEEFSSRNVGAYIENEFRPFDELIVTTGIRVDENSIYESSVNPRVGVVAFLPAETTLKVFYGRAFRGPNFLELFTDVQLGTFTVNNNPDLKPEKTGSAEVELTKLFASTYEAKINIFRNDLKDLISTGISGNQLFFLNIGKASTKGLELGIKGRITESLDWFANYSYQTVKDENRDIELRVIPEHTFSAGLFFTPGQRINIGVFGKYSGERDSTSLITGLPVVLDGFFKCDITFSAPIINNVELIANLYNLFDAEYVSGPESPQNGTQALVGLRFTGF